MSTKNTKKIDVHMLWIGEKLSQLEVLAINSFSKNGFNVNLWQYQSIANTPKNAKQRDANQILPESAIFTYPNGSYAGFANLFRYKLLSTEGGLWSDTDVVCLANSSLLTETPFLASERSKEGKININCNVVYNPHPKKGDIIDLALGVAERMDTSHQKWGETGPKLLTMLHRNYPNYTFRVMLPEACNPFNWWECPEVLLSKGITIPTTTKFLHCYNEMWRRKNVDKEASYPAGSIMSELALKYL